MPFLNGNRKACLLTLVSYNESVYACVIIAAITRHVSGAFVRSKAQRRQGLVTTASPNKSRNPPVG